MLPHVQQTQQSQSSLHALIGTVNSIQVHGIGNEVSLAQPLKTAEFKQMLELLHATSDIKRTYLMTTAIKS